jgi:hypothetical protein
MTHGMHHSYGEDIPYTTVERAVQGMRPPPLETVPMSRFDAVPSPLLVHV